MVRTLEELAAALGTLGLPFTYYSFNGKDVPALPYIAYYEAGSDNFGADNIVHAENIKVIIEFYSEYKDLENELKIKHMLNENKLFYETSDTFLEDEQVHITYFTIRLLS